MVVARCSWPRFCDQAFRCSIVLQSLSLEHRQRLAEAVRRVLRQAHGPECAPDDGNDRLGIGVRLAVRARDGRSGLRASRPPTSERGRRPGRRGAPRGGSRTHASKVSRYIGSTGKNQVSMVLPFFVRTSRPSWKTLPSTRSTCFSRSDAAAPSRAPVSMRRAKIALSRRSTSSPSGMDAESVGALLHRGIRDRALGVRRPSVLRIVAEVGHVGVGDARLVARLRGEPVDEALDQPQRRISRRQAQWLAGAGVPPLLQMALVARRPSPDGTP